MAGREAGDAFSRCADLQKDGTKHEAATNYINASGCYKKVWAEGVFADRIEASFPKSKCRSMERIDTAFEMA
jgi:hypothetical protein